MDAFNKLFSCYGICDTLGSNNGATFISEKFQINGIVHKTTSESVVQSFKPKSTIQHNKLKPFKTYVNV